MTKMAKLELDGKTYELPIIEGSENEKAIDITSLRGTTGHITIDNGYMNTGSCLSKITFLNGEKGVLRYRGYPIEELAEHSNFTEVSYLLNYGELPTSAQLSEFKSRMSKHNDIPEGVKNIINEFPNDAHPMGVVSSAISSLAAFYPEYLASELTTEQKDEVFAQMMAQVKVLISYFYRKTAGLPFVDSDPTLDHASDFLQMMFQGNGFKVDEKVARALNVLLILHADHEQNCSASTVRIVGSSHANIFATIASGIEALWGQLHGGANQAVLEMLQEIQDNGGDYKKFINLAKDKDHPFRLMGFGHRVYKFFDPRAQIIKKACHDVLDQLGVVDPLLDIAKGLEEEALKDDYFKDRNLYPNVDFYSGIIYRALGIPTNMFTAMFVLGRMPGWMSQWREMRETPGIKISRPRQVYTGETKREYLGEEKR
jgi:citrate synthase